MPFPTPAWLRAAGALGAIWLAPAALRAQEPADEQRGREYRVRALQVTTRNVFTEEEADHNLLYRLVNALHWPTDPDVVRTELWFGPGDPVDHERLEELERNLRAMRLFGEVVADLEPVEGVEGDLADVHVRTRDRFSLTVQGGVSFVGGVPKVSGTIGEINLFGSGKRIQVSGSDADDESSFSVSFTDPQLFDSWHVLDATGGTTDEGPFGALSVTRPFKFRDDPVSYGGRVAAAELGIDYFESGNSVAEVPLRRFDASGFVRAGSGPWEARSELGLDVVVRDLDYRPAEGREAASIRVPGDTREAELGVSWSHDWVARYLELERVDAIDFVEDLQLGARIDLRAAPVLRDEEGAGTSFQTDWTAGVRGAAAPLDETFFTFELNGNVRLDGSEAVAWRGLAALHVYNQSLPAQTLAASVRYLAADDDQNLDPEFTLGEDNGLRGYPARELAGDRQILLNVEDRIFTPVELWSFHLGLVAFFDVGWVDDQRQGLAMSDAARSVGFGFRLGSSELFGGRVARIDVGFPLDEFAGNDFDVSVSFSSRQVFSLFGSATELRADF